MSREEPLSQKRYSRWLAALLLAFASLGGVACEANVDADGGGEVEDGEDEGGVDTDVDVDTDEQGGEEGEEEGDDE